MSSRLLGEGARGDWESELEVLLRALVGWWRETESWIRSVRGPMASDVPWTIVIGVDVGGTNTDAALVLTAQEGASADLAAQLDAWEAALRGEDRAEEARALRAQREDPRREDEQREDARTPASFVLAFVKRTTTEDVQGGVTAAISSLLGGIWSGADVRGVFVGSTVFVNAIVQRKRSLLSRVGVLRLCGGGVWQHGAVLA